MTRFPHFTLNLKLFPPRATARCIWTPRTGIEAMPSVFLKARRRIADG